MIVSFGRVELGVELVVQGESAGVADADVRARDAFAGRGRRQGAGPPRLSRATVGQGGDAQQRGESGHFREPAGVGTPSAVSPGRPYPGHAPSRASSAAPSSLPSATSVGSRATPDPLRHSMGRARNARSHRLRAATSTFSIRGGPGELDAPQPALDQQCLVLPVLHQLDRAHLRGATRSTVPRPPGPPAGTAGLADLLSVTLNDRQVVLRKLSGRHLHQTGDVPTAGCRNSASDSGPLPATTQPAPSRRPCGCSAGHRNERPSTEKHAVRTVVWISGCSKLMSPGHRRDG